MDATEWDRRYAATELLWSSGPNRFFAEAVAELAPGRAIDLACGEGRNAIWLAEKGWQATGVDYSVVALAKAAELAEHRGVEVTWEQHDLVTWSPAPGAFDLVAMVYLQLPEPPRGAVLRAAVEALAPGGTLVVIHHDLDNLERGFGGPQDPAVLPTVEQVTAGLGGLRVERAEQVERVVPPHGERTEPSVAIDHLVVATRP